MLIITEKHTYSEIIKKSRFTVRTVHANSIDEALAFLKDVRDPGASHNAWAYRIGDDYRFSDDGEPGGTAGKPILGAIDNLNIDNVIVVVTRYFGGIKLGTGGLVRAYGKTALECLKEASKKEVHKSTDISFTCPFDLTGQIFSLLERKGIDQIKKEFTEEGVLMKIQIEERDLENFYSEIKSLGRGSITIKRG